MNKLKKSNIITLTLTLLIILVGVSVLIVSTDVLLKPNGSIKSVEQKDVTSDTNNIPIAEIKLYPWSSLDTEIQASLSSDDIDFFHSVGIEKQISEMIGVFYDSTPNRSDFIEHFKVLSLKDTPKKSKYYVLKDFSLDDNHLLNCIISSDGQIDSFYISNNGITDLQTCYQIVQKQLNNQLSDKNIKILSSLKNISANLNQSELFSIATSFPDYILNTTHSLYNMDNMITIKYQITDSTLFFLFIDGTTSDICGFHIQTY